MDSHLHSNYIKSSNLIFITAGLGVINLFFSNDLLINGQNIATVIITPLFVAGIGFLVRQGKQWVKYLLLVLTVLGLLGMLLIINSLFERTISGIINITQTIMQVWATILLFKIPAMATKGSA
jgi:hypothetical protein